MTMNWMPKMWFAQPNSAFSVILMKPDNKENAGLMSPISGIVLIMKDTHLPHLPQIWIIRASERPDLRPRLIKNGGR